MRDFRDAKAMARALRDALKAKGVETTHSESLELIATAFGYENWNILSAKIEAAATPASEERSPSSAGTQNDPTPPKTLYCSFCGKSQHEVQKLIAGPEVFICDECVDLCTGIVDPDDDKELFRLMTGDEETGGEPIRLCSSWLAGRPRKIWRTTWNVAGKAWSVTAAPCKVFSAGLRYGTTKCPQVTISRRYPAT
jgi:hypothetical protein